MAFIIYTASGRSAVDTRAINRGIEGMRSSPSPAGNWVVDFLSGLVNGHLISQRYTRHACENGLSGLWRRTRIELQAPTAGDAYKN